MSERDAVTELLKRARARLSDPDKWTGGFAAVDCWGCPCEPTDEVAWRWCAVGALRAEEAGIPWKAKRLGPAYTRLHQAAGMAPEDVNDEQGHEAVLRMFDEAIRQK